MLYFDTSPRSWFRWLFLLVFRLQLNGIVLLKRILRLSIKVDWLHRFWLALDRGDRRHLEVRWVVVFEKDACVANEGFRRRGLQGLSSWRFKQAGRRLFSSCSWVELNFDGVGHQLDKVLSGKGALVFLGTKRESEFLNRPFLLFLRSIGRDKAIWTWNFHMLDSFGFVKYFGHDTERSLRKAPECLCK